MSDALTDAIKTTATEQIAAIKAALDKVGMALLEEHTRGCVRRALLDDESADAAIRELTDVILRYLR